MKIDVTNEIVFKTARSGGKGGQNVNKVETMVEARWHIETSILITEYQKQILLKKLSNKITANGYVLVKCQQARSQLANKEIAIEKLNNIIHIALQKQKLRIATKIPKAAIEKRLETKKIATENKHNRKKINPNNF